MADSINRISLALIEKHDCSYTEAVERIFNFKLRITCKIECMLIASYQASLLTAINCGKRCFLGGVYLNIPSDIPLKIAWGNKKFLNEVVVELGALIDDKVKTDFTIKIGDDPCNENEIEIYCENYTGGVISYEDKIIKKVSEIDFPLSGVVGGGLAIAKAFYKVSGIQNLSTEKSAFISLLEPDKTNLDDVQPLLFNNFPKNIWLIGLGHLGQAYSWNLNFLPQKVKNEINIILQDFDKISDANFSSGLLSEKINVGQYKTRAVASWLEGMGFKTQIIEKKFDENIRRSNTEPFIALTGLDSLEARKQLGSAGFDLIIDCGLGGSLDNFDEIELNTFAEDTIIPSELWKDVKEIKIKNKKVYNKFYKNEICGVIAEENASKAISSSFVGVIAGAIATSELLRSVNYGKLFEKLLISVRSIKNREGISKKNYTTEAARNGFININ